MIRKVIFFAILLFLLLNGCNLSSPGNFSVIETSWGDVNGKPVKLITLKSNTGMSVSVSDYGATLVYLGFADRNGKIENVVIGYDSLNNYLKDRGQHGRTIGRYANRIGNAEFTLEGTTYTLKANNGPNSIHGGPSGFSTRVFNVDTIWSCRDSAVISLSYVSADMEEGFPGTLTLKLNYILTSENELKLEYKATTDKTTILNLTNHSYFNLTGKGDSVTRHKVRIISDSITTIGVNGLPTGELKSINDTPYDFTSFTEIGAGINKLQRGYDINYKLRKENARLSLAAVVYEPVSGRLIEAFTTEPGMQFYTDRTRTAFCLEMQHFPDSPHHPRFPSVVLRPGDTYSQKTIYRFRIIDDMNY